MSMIHARFYCPRKTFTLDVDLELPGEGVTAIWGPSGSGKTTLLRCLAGLERAEQGMLRVNEALWQGERVFLPPHRRALGYVFQEASLFPHMNVRANLAYAIKRARPGEPLITFEQAISLLGIQSLLNQYPSQLSGGERQRVAIARALLANPRVLLMDEPLASLDMARKQEILPYLDQLKRQLSIPIFYVSHSPEEVVRLADHLVVLNEGQEVVSGPLSETMARLDLPVHLGDDVGVVLEGCIVDHDPQWGLMAMSLAEDVTGGGNHQDGLLWLRDVTMSNGEPIRVRVLASDVSLALSRHNDSSILNILPAEVIDIVEDHDAGLVLVSLQAYDKILIARVTQRSAHYLMLSPGCKVWAQVKSAALIR